MRYPKKVFFEKEARELMLKGVDTVARAVGKTLGPKGRNVAINTPFGSPLVLHDGVSVAKAIDLVNPFEDMGAQLIKAAAQNTNDKAGDGTTTSTILAHSIITKGMEMVGTGTNPMTLKAEIESASEEVVSELKKLSKDVSSDDELEQVATISSADPLIGKIVADTVKKMGKEGIVTVEQGQSVNTTVSFTVGMEIDRGYMSSQFTTDNKRIESVIEDAYILITDRKLVYNYEILPFFEKFLKESGSKNIVIFVDDIQDEALASLTLNHIRGSIKCCVVKTPSFGERRVRELSDIAVLTGGTVFYKDSGRGLDTVLMTDLGRASKVVVNSNKTTIYEGKGSDEAIKQRISDLKDMIKTSTTGFETDVLKERLAKLSSGVAIINVGGQSETELKERKERVIDAVNATKAAIEEGVVAGGEITLVNISNMDFWDKHNNPGGRVLRESLRQPFKVLVENAGMDYAECWGKLSGKKYPLGIDVMDGQIKDLIKCGVIDPTMVTRSAIQNAVSVSTMALTTDVLISEPINEDK